jgi:hypothetical protein
VDWNTGWKLLTKSIKRSKTEVAGSLVLTLNKFSFDGEHYQQINGVAMGTKMEPNHAC